MFQSCAQQEENYRINRETVKRIISLATGFDEHWIKIQHNKGFTWGTQPRGLISAFFSGSDVQSDN